MKNIMKLKKMSKRNATSMGKQFLSRFQGLGLLVLMFMALEKFLLNLIQLIQLKQLEKYLSNFS